MLSWTIRIDRRKADRDAVAAALAMLGASVKDLVVVLGSPEDYWAAPDVGAFRDFVEFATISHPAEAGLEYAAEELLESFGWLVDFQRS
ncbi:MAG: hypothetical protein H0U74_20650 [Bradymonadaceae bacterium]|nr:hypothetical protein [Lujinxingiaceae bacterium]